MQATLGLERHFDARRLNEMANHESVRASLGGDGKSVLDLGPWIKDKKNHALVWAHGFFMFHWSAPHTYEVHISVLPEGRGRDAYHMAQEGIDYITAHGAERLWARVAKDADALRHYTVHAGFKKCGSDFLDIGFGPVEYDLYQWKSPCLPL